MEIFKELPQEKRAYMELLFRNCTEEVRYYMSLVEIPANQTFIKAGTECTQIFMILSICFSLVLSAFFILSK